MKRPGDEEPAFAQTMSGAWELFHDVVSLRMRVLSSGEVQSALTARKRWFGVLACDWAVGLAEGHVLYRDRKYGSKYLDVVDCLIEFGLISGDNADIGTLLSQLSRESLSHAT